MINIYNMYCIFMYFTARDIAAMYLAFGNG